MLVGREIATSQDVLGAWDRLWPSKTHKAEESQEYFVDLANAVFRTPLANESGFRAWASSQLIDLALRSPDERASVDSTGRRVGGPEHEQYVSALEAVGETSRQRRSYYGERWLDAADEAIAEGDLGIRKSYSPRRSRSYVLVATPLGQGPQELTLRQVGLDAMLEHETESCLVLAAPAASIRATYEYLLKVVRNEKSETPEKELCLAPTIVWFEPVR